MLGLLGLLGLAFGIVLHAGSALPSKNAVSAYQKKYKLLPFTSEEICRNEQTINSLS